MKFRGSLAVIVCVVSFGTGKAMADTITIGKNAKSFHIPNGQNVHAVEDALTSDNAYTSKGICMAVNLPWCGAWLRAADIGMNAAMVGRPADESAADTHYELLYGADLARQYPNLYGIVLAHIIGHQWCGHLNGYKIKSWDAELEADAFAGAAMRTFYNNHEMDGSAEFSQQAVEGALALMGKRPSASHPPRPLRIKALMNGYENPRDTISKCWDRPHGNRLGQPGIFSYDYDLELEAKGLAWWRAGWSSNWND